jgi:hypothetical protein
MDPTTAVNTKASSPPAITHWRNFIHDPIQ